MIQHSYPYYQPVGSYGMQGIPQQMPTTGQVQNPSQYLIPGITPSPLSPGGGGAWSAGSPPIPSFGTDLPPEQAAQLYGQIPLTPQTGGSPFEIAPGSPTYLGPEYTQGFLRTQIGQNVRVEFLFGTDSLMDRRGKLLEVGIDYITLMEERTDDILYCDIYSIKFVTIYK